MRGEAGRPEIERNKLLLTKKHPDATWKIRRTKFRRHLYKCVQAINLRPTTKKVTSAQQSRGIWLLYATATAKHKRTVLAQTAPEQPRKIL